VLSFVVRGNSILNEVRIEKWVYGGDGLARQDGRVVLTPFVLPGELVRIEEQNGIHAELKEIVEPAPERTAPPCPVFTRCGGCHYQHAPYEFQLARKVEIVREQLRRVGKIDFQGEIDVISGPPLEYRNRSQFHIGEGPGGKRAIGYLAARSHELIPVEDRCPISSPGVNAALAAIREKLNDARFPKFLRQVEIFSNESELQINALETDRPIARSFFEEFKSVVALEYATAHGKFRVSPHSFFQVNRFLIDAMIDRALAFAQGSSALDLYSGVGLFALPLSKKFGKVTAIESGSGAIRDLQQNAPEVGAVQGRAEEHLARIEKAPDFVLADPPRAGLGKTVVANLNRLRAPRMTVVSCDPATLARDLAALNYRLERLTLIDLFPQTFHIETIADLTVL
jgi:23S rRNA (uracil1939-C5)-methyltransferase